MAFLYELFPVLLFFVAFKWYGIYAATVVGMVASLLQVIFYRLYKHRWDNKQVITLAVFIVFGGMTLYFHNPIFVKWKPTIVFWIFALVIFMSPFVMLKPIAQRLLENMGNDKIELPSKAWRLLNLSWAGFFMLLGSINLYIAYHYDNETWVNFKFYGITSALLLFSLVQACYLIRHLPRPSNEKSK